MKRKVIKLPIRRWEAHSGVLGIDLDAAAVWDGNIPIAWSRELTQADRKAVADYAIRLWREFAADNGGGAD